MNRLYSVFYYFRTFSVFLLRNTKGEMPMAKNYDELTLTDDFMFGKVAPDQRISHDLLEYLTQEPVGVLEEIRLEDTPDDLKTLYDYLQNGNVTDELTARIDDAVKKARKNEKWRSEYMKELVHDEDIREEGRAEERANTEREKARADSLEEKVRELEAIIRKMENHRREINECFLLTGIP